VAVVVIRLLNLLLLWDLSGPDGVVDRCTVLNVITKDPCHCQERGHVDPRQWNGRLGYQEYCEQAIFVENILQTVILKDSMIRSRSSFLA